MFSKYNEVYTVNQLTPVEEAVESARGSFGSSVKPVRMPGTDKKMRIRGVAKLFAADALGAINTRALTDMVSFARKLGNSPDERELARNIAWPVAVINSSNDGGHLVGYVMPDHASTNGLCHQGALWPPMNALIRNRSVAAAMDAEFFEDDEAISRLGKLADLIQRLHTVGVEVGDLALENALMSPLGYRPAVYLVDSDSFILDGKQCCAGFRVLSDKGRDASDWDRFYIACSRALMRNPGVKSMTEQDLVSIFPDGTDQAMIRFFDWSLGNEDGMDPTRSQVLSMAQRWIARSKYVDDGLPAVTVPTWWCAEDEHVESTPVPSAHPTVSPGTSTAALRWPTEDVEKEPDDDNSASARTVFVRFAMIAAVAAAALGAMVSLWWWAIVGVAVISAVIVGLQKE